MLHNSYKTKTSDLISQFVETRHEHGFTAGDLSEFLRSHGLEVNKTTVYRNLDKLAASGHLVKHKSPVSDGYIYSTADEESHCCEHIHFRCRECGAVLHLSDSATADSLRAIAEHLGLEIDLSSSTLNGLCQKCKEIDKDTNTD